MLRFSLPDQRIISLGHSTNCNLRGKALYERRNSMKPSANVSLGCVVILAALAVFSPDRALVAHEADAPKPATFNHYPILARLKEDGVILDMYASYPAMHLPENARWDMRFTVVLADPKHTYEYMYTPELIRELYPDQETFKKEEQRRFELLEAHMDIPQKMFDLSEWSTTPE
jgi:hypothetical protein